MSPRLEAQLYEAFPLLYTEHTLPPESSAMSWGCTCGDGWFALLWQLSNDLNLLIQHKPEAERPEYRATQVKEKLGGLRYHMHRFTPAMRDLILHAEAESMRLCDVCGDPGALIRGPGLWRTRCTMHPEAIASHT